MMRLGTLPEGVWKGVFPLRTEAAAEDRALSLLRERFEDEGDAEKPSGAGAMFSTVLRPPLSLTFALRRRSRRLCSLEVVLELAPGEIASSGAGGARRFEGGIVNDMRAADLDENGAVAYSPRGDRAA